MPKTIQQSVTLPAPAADLYRMYLDPKRHAALTEALRPRASLVALPGGFRGSVPVPGCRDG